MDNAAIRLIKDCQDRICCLPSHFIVSSGKGFGGSKKGYRLRTQILLERRAQKLAWNLQVQLTKILATRNRVKVRRDGRRLERMYVDSVRSAFLNDL